VHSELNQTADPKFVEIWNGSMPFPLELFRPQTHSQIVVPDGHALPEGSLESFYLDPRTSTGQYLSGETRAGPRSRPIPPGFRHQPQPRSKSTEKSHGTGLANMGGFAHLFPGKCLRAKPRFYGSFPGKDSAPPLDGPVCDSRHPHRDLLLPVCRHPGRSLRIFDLISFSPEQVQSRNTAWM
jgi:hypothetical protein